MEQFKDFVLKHFKIITVVASFALTMYVQHLNNTRQIVELETRCDKLEEKIQAQYDRIDAIKLDKAVFEATMALDARALQLTLDEYKRFRAEDAATIKRLGVRIKNLEAAARHELEVAGPIDAAIRDTVIIRDAVPILRQKVEMLTPHIELSGIIENERLQGAIRVPVTLHQAVWVECKGCWFWRRVNAMHQNESSDNPTRR